MGQLLIYKHGVDVYVEHLYRVYILLCFEQIVLADRERGGIRQIQNQHWCDNCVIGAGFEHEGYVR